jgi:hypothetical protein
MQTIRHVNHADDLKVSHVKPPIITRMASQLKGANACLVTVLVQCKSPEEKHMSTLA